MRHEHILTLSCPDRTGIVHRVSGSLFDAGCNILDAQQFGDGETGRFFLCVHFESQVLARAVRRHIEHRILPNGHRTIVFR